MSRKVLYHKIKGEPRCAAEGFPFFALDKGENVPAYSAAESSIRSFASSVPLAFENL